MGLSITAAIETHNHIRQNHKWTGKWGAWVEQDRLLTEDTALAYHLKEMLATFLKFLISLASPSIWHLIVFSINKWYVAMLAMERVLILLRMFNVKMYTKCGLIKLHLWENPVALDYSEWNSILDYFSRCPQWSGLTEDVKWSQIPVKS